MPDTLTAPAGALPPVAAGLPQDHAVRMLVEPLVAELLAQHWWSAAGEE